MVEESGFEYRPNPDVVPNSQKALELTELARDLGLETPVHDRLMHAVWSEARDIGQEDVLLDLVSDAGLDRDEAAAALADGRYRSRVLSSTEEAHAIGINAIPAFLLDGRLLLVGAHPHEVFERAFEQLAHLRAGE